MLLTTKLFVPRPPARAVPRGRLFDQLEAAEKTPLMLVSAPAGFGKTALVGGWVRERQQPAAWLSLDEGDNDAGRFWSYLIAALRTVHDGIAESALQLLQSPHPPSGETVATIVINDLAAFSQQVVCVLDDYHVISAETIHAGVVFLVEHMPHNGRLIVTTRADPPWPIARLRAGEQMRELRAADLRFTEEEASLFLARTGLSLSAGDVRTLEARTEGWIAGLQMAALSMQDRSNRERFIRDFAGSHRFVLDYLAQEVLDRQPESTRSFLMQTSILERLNGALCEAVTGAAGGQQILEELEQTNLFTECLDDERRWYRYHPLFAEVLRSQLAKPDTSYLEPELHRRASEWFEAEGLEEQAIHHALNARDIDRATRLIARTASATFMVGNQLLVLEWLRQLPKEVTAGTPLLALIHAWACFVTGDWEAMVPALEAASASIGSAAASAEREALQAQLDGIRSWAAYQTGDLDSCVALANAALERMPEDGLVPRWIISSAQSYGLLLLGEKAAARAAASETIAQSRRGGDALTECLAIGLEAQAHLLDGELASAARAYERAVVAGTVGGEPLPSVAIAQVQLAEVLRERDELEKAERMLRTSIAACEQALGLPEWVFEGNVTLARILAARGDADGSRQAVDDAERVLQEEIVPGGMQPIVGRALCYHVRYWLNTGDVERAARWLRRWGVSTEDKLDGSREILYLLLARTLLAQGAHERAARVVDRLSLTLGDEPPVALAVELPLVKALSLQATGREEEGAQLAAEALRAAEPDGYVRLFVDDGVPMLGLLQRAASAHPAVAGYVERLVSAFSARGSQLSDPTVLRIDDVLRDSLNERELELLHLFAAGRSNREIAEELYLSVNTVKWHARHVYAKLGVNRRALAVVRARELNIL